MKFSAIFLVLLGAVAPGRAVEVAASGIALPFYNEAGQLTHKMAAARGASAGPLRRLEAVEITYFSPDRPTLVTQRLQADEALWDERKGVLSGAGAITVTTEENRLTGEGFDFTLATSLLHIHHDFRMENREAILTSNRATAELLVGKTGDAVQVRDIKWCEAVGNLQIVVQPTATGRYEFQRASSDLAVYDGIARTVTLPHAIDAIRRSGQPATINTMTIRLGRPAGSATAPAMPRP